MAAPTTEFGPPEDTRSEENTLPEIEDATLFRHKKRPQWGVAILAWERGKQRAYQFEDGRLRKFKEGYYSLMEPAENLERPREVVVAGLQDAIKAKIGKTDHKALTPVCSFEAQVELFTELFPEGFQDPEWINEHRSKPSGRTLKRYRDPVVAQARETLSRKECEDLLVQERHEDLTLAVQEILASTNLLPISAVKVLKALESEENREFAESVTALLHGEGDFDGRFKEHLEVLRKIYGKRPSWRIATALPALVYPEKQVCVRRSVFLRQAASISPNARYTKRASASAYRNFRRVAFAVRKRLQAAGHEPRDLLDIHDFIWLTLRNAALEHVKN